MESLDITFYSLNANGLGDKAKRIAFFAKLKKLEKGIFLLQETQSIKESNRKYLAKLVGESKYKILTWEFKK